MRANRTYDCVWSRSAIWRNLLVLHMTLIFILILSKFIWSFRCRCAFLYVEHQLFEQIEFSYEHKRQINKPNNHSDVIRIAHRSVSNWQSPQRIMYENSSQKFSTRTSLLRGGKLVLHNVTHYIEMRVLQYSAKCAFLHPRKLLRRKNFVSLFTQVLSPFIKVVVADSSRVKKNLNLSGHWEIFVS